LRRCVLFRGGHLDGHVERRRLRPQAQRAAARLKCRFDLRDVLCPARCPWRRRAAPGRSRARCRTRSRSPGPGRIPSPARAPRSCRQAANGCPSATDDASGIRRRILRQRVQVPALVDPGGEFRLDRPAAAAVSTVDAADHVIGVFSWAEASPAAPTSAAGNDGTDQASQTHVHEGLHRLPTLPASRLTCQKQRPERAPAGIYAIIERTIAWRIGRTIGRRARGPFRTAEGFSPESQRPARRIAVRIQESCRHHINSAPDRRPRRRPRPAMKPQLSAGPARRAPFETLVHDPTPIECLRPSIWIPGFAPG